MLYFIWGNFLFLAKASGNFCWARFVSPSYIFQLVCALWLVNLVGHISLCLLHSNLLFEFKGCNLRISENSGFQGSKDIRDSDFDIWTVTKSIMPQYNISGVLCYQTISHKSTSFNSYFILKSIKNYRYAIWCKKKGIKV